MNDFIHYFPIERPQNNVMVLFTATLLLKVTVMGRYRLYMLQARTPCLAPRGVVLGSLWEYNGSQF